MRRNSWIIWLGATGVALALQASSTALATLDPDFERGESRIQIPVDGRRPELCVIPKHFEPGSYSHRDLKAEKDLCELDESKNVAVCPKLNSSNPGLDFYQLADGMTPAQAEAANCRAPNSKKKHMKMIGKYKLSTSCSYTPSILAYYHVSRMLGGVGQVPPSVLRTYDLKNHLALADIALGETAPDDLIHQTWAGLQQQLEAGAQGRSRNLLLTAAFDQSYGALSAKPTGELFYKEFFNGGADNVTRTANFRDLNSIYRAVTSPQPATTQVHPEFTAANVQKMLQMKEAADMIVIDTLLSQQDRMGNIHYQIRQVYLDQNHLDASGTPTLMLAKKLAPSEAKALGAVSVKVMILKDNDCGVNKDNLDKQAGLADRIAHLDPETYRRLLRLNEYADAPEMMAEFTDEMLFTAADYKLFRQNLKTLATGFQTRCKQGSLKLDLDLLAHFTNAAGKTAPSCDL